jgi:hypothetical protein
MMETERQQGKSNVEMVEQTSAAEHQMPISKGEGHHLMRSKADQLSVWRSVLLFRRVGCIAMIAAFCAALDGYRRTCQSTKKPTITDIPPRDQPQWRNRREQGIRQAVCDARDEGHSRKIRLRLGWHPIYRPIHRPSGA